ncbi:hypothetical protein BS78_08G045000 [Paspalum vaginatum]|nr:hypothetical protein BS78_08G045000 [Paspalum vaginatum]
MEAAKRRGKWKRPNPQETGSADLEKAAGEVVSGGDIKRPREGKDDHRAMEMYDDEDEEGMKPHEIFEIYRSEWIQSYGKNDPAAFYKPTEMPPMRCTDGPVLPASSEPMDTIEIYFVKVASLAGGLKWPVDVYGDVAIRDSQDWMHNYLFRRDRNNCQTLTSPQACVLQTICKRYRSMWMLVGFGIEIILTSMNSSLVRAIILLDEPIFEIDLKVKGKGSSSSEDKVLCLHYFGYKNIAYRGAISYARTEDVSSESCAMSFRFAHVRRTVEATITSRVTSGSGRFAVRFTACTASIGEDVVLLDSRGQEVPVAEDGEVLLRRRVVVVEHVRELLHFTAWSALRSLGLFVIGSVRIQILVAWSMLT